VVNLAILYNSYHSLKAVAHSRNCLLNSNGMRILLNCYSDSVVDIKLKLLVFCSLEKGVLEDWVFREFRTPKYSVIAGALEGNRRDCNTMEK
jgi:hypothetical protein